MKMVAVLPLYNTSSTNDSHSIMNVTGKRFERNPSKTIWSYAPSDCLLKKADRKWRSNQNQGYTPNNTTTLASNSLGNFSELLETYKLKQLSAVSFSNQATNIRSNDENVNHADTMTSSVFFEPNNRHKDSKVLSIEKKKLHNSSSIMNVDTKKSNESNNNNPITNKSLVSFKDEDNIHVTRSYYFEFKDRKSLRSATKSEKSTLAETSYQNFTVNPSVNVKSANSRKSAKTTSSNKLTTTTTLNDKLANGKHVVFGEHIDNLSNSLFSALSNGINKNLLSKNDNNKSVSSTMTLNSFHDDDYRDLSSLHKIYDREDSLVLKICNEIKSCKETNNKILKGGEKSVSNELNEKDELVSEFFKKEKSKSVKIAEPEVSFFDLNSNKIFEYDDLEMTSDFPASYFDCKSLDDEFEYKYQNAINKQCEQVLTQYDGNLPVEVALKQFLPDYSIIAQSAKSRRDSIDSKSSAYDMKKLKKKGSNLDLSATNKEADILNLLKRMMVKKKYEIATIRLEKASSVTNDKKKKRLTSAQPSAPTTSAATSAVLSSVKTARPKTSVITPAFIEIKPFTEDDDEEFEQIENDDVFLDEPKVNRCASCKKVLKASTDKCISEDDLYYNEYQITKEAFEQYEWPFEMNYSNSFANKKEDERKKQASSKKSLNDNSKRCFSCAKVFFTDFSSKSEFSNFTEEKKTKPSQISSKKSPQPVMEAVDKKINNKDIKNVNANANDSINIDSKKISINNINNNNSNNNNNNVNINKDVDACRFKNATFSSSRHCVSDNKLNDIIDVPPLAENKSNCAHSILMNSIEILKYQRKSSILPGKTFYSQRRQSISIRPPSLSKIKEDNVKEINTISFIYPIETVKLLSPRSEKSNGEIAAVNSKNKTTNSLHASMAVDSFKLDPFNPIKAKPPQKISNLKNEPISAFQIYKKTSKMICRRPKTAKN